MDGEEMAPSVLPQAQKVAPISAINVIAKFLPQKKIKSLLVTFCKNLCSQVKDDLHFIS